MANESNGRAYVIDFGSTDVVPHVAARKTHQRLLEFLFATPKRLLQQYPPVSGHRQAVSACPKSAPAE
jgi:hypothetical protein